MPIGSDRLDASVRVARLFHFLRKIGEGSNDRLCTDVPTRIVFTWLVPVSTTSGNRGRW